VIRLVINADDLGLHPAIDAGILRAHREGVVTSASILIGGATAPDAIRRAVADDLALGVHLCLSSGLPPVSGASEVPSLAPRGVFRLGWADVARAWVQRELREEEIDRELRAQIRRARELGARPDHLDGHQHLHLLPGVSAIVARIAEEEGLAVRWPREHPCAEWLRAPGAAARSLLLSGLSLLPRVRPRRRLRALGAFASGALDEAQLLRLLDSLGEGNHEILCHPGEDPTAVPEVPNWRYGWKEELAALCSPRVRQRIEARGIRLTTYGALFG
jgi:chitin disaccharide deacetylase